MSRQEFSRLREELRIDGLGVECAVLLWREISYAQGDYKDAVGQYNVVLSNYPQSYKLAASLLKKGHGGTGIGNEGHRRSRFEGSGAAFSGHG